jgi:biotin/methionine sulfoxide reductase
MAYTTAHWGIYETRSGEDGLEILSWHEDPDPSPIGLAMAARELDAVRIARPAVRRSWLEQGPGANPHLRGREPFVEVDWATATALVGDEVRRVAETFGNEAIFGGSYGWASAGRFHHAQSQVHRFLNLAGGYVGHVDNYSLGAGRVILPHVVASTEILLDMHTSWDVLQQSTDLFVAFGGVPVKNAQMSSGGAARHRVRPALDAMAQRGCRFINISPVEDSVPVAAEWIAIRPNTDVAMMLAIAHTLLVEDRADRAFLASHCVGFETFARYLTGASDGVAKTPGWAAEITGVDADRIARLAREMHAARTMINVSWSLQRAVHGEQPFWMTVVLAAMLGQIGLPGGGFGVGYGALNSVGHGNAKFKGPTFPQGENPVKAFIPVARIADMLLDPGGTFTYNGKTQSYPDIKLVYWAGGNPFHHHQDLNRLMTAWQRPETIVVNEQSWTATAKFADIVLPATTMLERDDIGSSGGEEHVVAMKQAVTPFAEARDDHAIFAAISAHLGFGEAFTEGRTVEQWLAHLYEAARDRAGDKARLLPPFAKFWEQELVDLAPMAAPIVMLSAFRADPQRHPLPTPSGKIEIFSETVAGFALEDCAGHPTWYAPPEWLGSPAAQTTPLHLVSDQPTRRLHSQLDASPHSRAGKIDGREPIDIHPSDAAARGVVDGDCVEIFNARGHCLSTARVTAGIMPGVLRLSTGAWFDPDPTSGLERHGNPNALTLDRGASTLSQGCSAQTCLVDLRKWAGEAPATTAFDRPPFVAPSDRRPG